MSKSKNTLFPALALIIEELQTSSIPIEREPILKSLIEYIQQKIDSGEITQLNFICTHNSRRSHLSQVWAQTLAAYFNIDKLACYSGGTEATALFPMVAKTLKKQGFQIDTPMNEDNPKYHIHFSEALPPIIGFSKIYDDAFNPQTNFAAIMTCSQADEGCPFIPGAEMRIALTYEDPKAFDNTPQQEEKYRERSIQIATEMKYVFSNIK